jgi:hypothetical protein
MPLKTPEALAKFESDIENLLQMDATELAKIKGFSFNSVATVITLLVSQAITALPTWNMASPIERKQAVVNVVNKYVDLPVLGEKAEGAIFGFIYDILILSISKG